MSEYSDWEAQFNKQIAIQIKNDDKSVIGASKVLLTRIISKTPIGNPSLWSYPAPKGYTPGALKASWNIQINNSRNGVTIEIKNEQPYAERVEYGWSSQAPQGMMRTSLLEWPAILNAEAEKNNK